MPGYVIHLATANEYMNKHKDAIKNKDEFYKGVIAPDLTTKEGKINTHFGKNSSQANLRKYLEHNNNNIETDFDKGFFLHLVTDYIFYNKVLTKISTELYNDYDILNRSLIEKYNVIIPEEVKNTVFFKEGETKILNFEDAVKTIDLASNQLLEDIKMEILSSDYTEKWDILL
jgi:poly-D-alanine transfer protein DltD